MSLGIIGGLGPMATAYFLELLVSMTKADCDQEHLEMIVYHSPGIPDRTAFILGQSEDNPLPRIKEYVYKLQEQKVDAVAIPCITAHYFHDKLQEGISVPVIHAIEETARTLKAAGLKKVGIMATDGTVKSRIFQSKINDFGMEAITPDSLNQQKVMDLIYKDVKAGKPADMDKFFQVRDHLKDAGAQVIVLGCTELSVIKKDNEIGPGFIDAMEVLSKAAIIKCGKEVKDEYETLFVPFS